MRVLRHAARRAGSAAQEIRKTVTIVFSDLKGSTDLGERLDSESLREVMTRYFEAMRAELERHGGTVEKYIGDAVMAVFGLPTLHEDDALRAVRAAAEMQRALAALNDELERTWGVRLANRTGVNTGEVVAGDPTAGQRLVTGDAVNIAARLEQAAPPDEVLIGEPTYRLVRDAVEVEPVEPLELKGKARAGAAPIGSLGRRVGRPAASATRRRWSDASRELALLREAFERVVGRAGRCRLVTIVGDAGVGKSRLTAGVPGLASTDEAHDRPRPLPAVRRGHHVLADRRDRPRRRPGSTRTTRPSARPREARSVSVGRRRRRRPRSPRRSA